MSAREFEEAVSIPYDKGLENFSKEALDLAYEEAEKISDSDKLDLRQEVFSQIKLLRSIRRHLFHPSGVPKAEIEFKDIRSYLASSNQLLQMLQRFEESLKTDADISRIETAIEMALEDCPCTEFIKALKTYLSGDSEI